MVIQPVEAVESSAVGASVKLSVNVSSGVGDRLRQIAFEERVSESSIVQIALKLLFERTSDVGIGSFLRDQGASLRRGAR